MNNQKTKFQWWMWQGVGGFSWFMWVASSFLSYWGFTHSGSTVVWWMQIIAIGFAIGINFVEFMLDNMNMDDLLSIHNVGDVVLRVFGVVCYLYDIWTNILGFLVIIVGLTSNNLIQAFQINTVMSIFAVLFGIGFAIGPEPLYIKFLKEKFPYPQTYRKNPLVPQDNTVSNFKPFDKYQHSPSNLRPKFGK